MSEYNRDYAQGRIDFAKEVVDKIRCIDTCYGDDLSVKIKFIVAFVPPLILYEIFTLGKVANKLNHIIISWIYRKD